MVICRTEKELERALEAKENKIILEDQIAEHIIDEIENAERAKRNKSIFASILGGLCIIAAPFTGGSSLLGLAATTVCAASISTEVLVAIIGGLTTISVAAIHAIKEYKIRKLEYNRIELTRA